MTPGRAAALIEKELYRPVKVKGGNKVTSVPALRVATRKLIALALKDDISALRILFQLAQDIDRLSAQASLQEPYAGPAVIVISESDAGLF